MTRWILFLVLVAQVLRPATEETILRVGLLRPDGTYSVASIPLETYVARVLTGEAARDSPPAALDALAITIRTYALANRGRHRADGFDLCDQTHCQVVRTVTAANERAATRTAGLVLLRDSVPASIYYTASCGGRTEVPSAVWPGAEDPPFLPSRPDDACGGAPEWTTDLSTSDLQRALSAAGFRGARLRDLEIVSRDASGRVAELRMEGLTPDRISGQDLRVVVGRTLGWQHIKSTAFELDHTRDRYRFDGHGSGHGVGLCVIGSARLAADGRRAPEILERYFPGLTIGVPGARPVKPVATEVLLTLPEGDEGERAALEQLALDARSDLARTLSVAPPARVMLRFHPTTLSYERATGRPWFTSGAIVNGELHLLPLAVLRERGVLERTVRREIVRLIVDPVLAQRPAWVREGVAAYYAGDDPQRAVMPRVSCPTDAELGQPVSAGAFSNALARALSCVSRQIDSGRSWKELR